MKDYRLKVALGDLVQLPEGNLARVVDIDYSVGGNSKVVVVKPIGVFGFWLNLIWSLTKRFYTFTDEEINQLTLPTWRT